MKSPDYFGGDGNACELAHDMDDNAGRVAPPQQVVAQPLGHALGPPAGDHRQPPARESQGAGERGVRCQRTDGGVDHRRVDASGPKLGAQPGGAIAARAPALHPLARERGVVQISTSGEIGNDRIGDLGGGAAADQAPRQVGPGPRTPREQIGRDQSCRTLVELAKRTSPTLAGLSGRGAITTSSSASGYGLLKNGLDVGGLAAASSCFFFSPSNVSSPVEKMPRTLRSKSSGLVAASRAVSYDTTLSR